MDEAAVWIGNILQAIGGLIVALAYLPQIAQILRTRSSRDVNRRFLAWLCVGIAMMEFYAGTLVFLQGSGHAFLLTNTVSLVMVITLIIVARKYGAPAHEGGES